MLPVLPLVLAAATGRHRLGPVALAGGMAAAFVAAGLALAAAGPALGLTEDDLARAGAAAMAESALLSVLPAWLVDLSVAL